MTVPLVYVPYDMLLNWALYDIKYIRESARRFTDLEPAHQAILEQWLREEQPTENSITVDLAKTWRECLDHNIVPYPNREIVGYFKFYHYKFVVNNIVQCVEQGLPLVLMDELPIATNEYPLFSEPPFYNWINQTTDPNSMDAFRRGVLAVTIKEWIRRSKLENERYTRDMAPAAKEKFHQWIQANEPAWELFVKAGRMEKCWTTYDRQWLMEGVYSSLFIRVPIPDLYSFSELSLWRSKLHHQKGELPAAVEDCLALTRAGTHYVSWGSYSQQTNATYYVWQAGKEILDIISFNRLNSNDLYHVQQEWEKLFEEGYPLFNLDMDRVLFLETVQKYYTSSGPGGGHLIYDKVVENWPNTGPIGWDPINAVGKVMLHAGRDEMIALGEQLFQELEKELRMSPYQQHQNHITPVSDQQMALRTGRYSFIQKLMRVSYNMEGYHQNRAWYYATTTILALHRWKSDKGEYPDQLETLKVGGYLKQLPEDPYGEGILQYQKKDDDFILYSFGADFEDDKGWDKNFWFSQGNFGDWVIWPIR